jgi:hypothetical protein
MTSNHRSRRCKVLVHNLCMTCRCQEPVRPPRRVFRSPPATDVFGKILLTLTPQDLSSDIPVTLQLRRKPRPSEHQFELACRTFSVLEARRSVLPAGACGHST